MYHAKNDVGEHLPTENQSNQETNHVVQFKAHSLKFCIDIQIILRKTVQKQTNRALRINVFSIMSTFKLCVRIKSAASMFALSMTW